MSIAHKFQKIGIKKEYSDIDYSSLPFDTQGWGSNHPIFNNALRASMPKVVIEVGTWKGASLINMAKLSKDFNLETNFICVDTWLGSNDTLWLNDKYRSLLGLRGGYPNMFPQFIANIHHAGIQNKVYPLPMTSTSAYFLLKKMNIIADLVYIDAGHEEDEVYLDLLYYYDLLRSGGVLFGDDYNEAWPGVVAAVNKFAAEKKLLLECGAGKFMFKKPEKKLNSTVARLRRKFYSILDHQAS